MNRSDMIKIFIDCVKQERYKYVEDIFSSYEIVHMGLEEFRDVIRKWANNNKNDIHTCYSPFINHVGRFRRDFGENWLGEEVRVFAPEYPSRNIDVKYREYRFNDKGQLTDWPYGLLG